MWSRSRLILYSFFSLLFCPSISEDHFLLISSDSKHSFKTFIRPFTTLFSFFLIDISIHSLLVLIASSELTHYGRSSGRVPPRRSRFSSAWRRRPKPRLRRKMTPSNRKSLPRTNPKANPISANSSPPAWRRRKRWRRRKVSRMT